MSDRHDTEQAIETMTTGTPDLGDEAATETSIAPSLFGDDTGRAAAPSAVVGELRLSSPGQAQMTAIALAGFAADLKKLAKDARALGKLKLATEAEKDAQLITEDLLAQLEPQAKLPFGYADVRAALSARIAGTLRTKLAATIRRETPLDAERDPHGTDRALRIDARINEFESLVGNVAEIVVALVVPVVVQAAERGLVAGRLARETTAETLATEAAEVVANG
jgi:hypothetical protein